MEGTEHFLLTARSEEGTVRLVVILIAEAQTPVTTILFGCCQLNIGSASSCKACLTSTIYAKPTKSAYVLELSLKYPAFSSDYAPER